MDTKPQIRAAIRAQRLASMQALQPTFGAAAEPAAETEAIARATHSYAEMFALNLASLVTEHEAKRVSCFVSVRGEPDTSAFFAWALQSGIEVLLPRVISDTHMEWALLTHDPLVAGAFGVPEPTGPAVDPRDSSTPLDLMFIPAAAVDRAGTRLGWGRGYFDRELASIHTAHTPPLYAVVFEHEIFDRLPTEPHDVPVTGAVSEVATHLFG